MNTCSNNFSNSFFPVLFNIFFFFINFLFSLFLFGKCGRKNIFFLFFAFYFFPYVVVDSFNVKSKGKLTSCSPLPYISLPSVSLFSGYFSPSFVCSPSNKLCVQNVKDKKNGQLPQNANLHEHGGKRGVYGKSPMKILEANRSPLKFTKAFMNKMRYDNFGGNYANHPNDARRIHKRKDNEEEKKNMHRPPIKGGNTGGAIDIRYYGNFSSKIDKENEDYYDEEDDENTSMKNRGGKNSKFKVREKHMGGKNSEQDGGYNEGGYNDENDDSEEGEEEDEEYEGEMEYENEEVVEEEDEDEDEEQEVYDPMNPNGPIDANNYGDAWVPQTVRLRRNRKNNIIRNMLEENTVKTSNFIYPIFIHDKEHSENISSMPGIKCFSERDLMNEVDECVSYGLRSFILFPRIAHDLKTALCEESYNDENIVARAIRRIKHKYGDSVMVFSDVALDAYNIYGHDGIVDYYEEETDDINDEYYNSNINAQPDTLQTNRQTDEEKNEKMTNAEQNATEEEKNDDGKTIEGEQNKGRENSIKKKRKKKVLFYDILNDETVATLCKQAICHARAGADVVSPSDMMDGRVGALRDSLDSEGFTDVNIMSYACKYASSLYSPFRHAADSPCQIGDKKTYQLNFSNSREAEREASLDVNEGADILLVKPGMAYLDILSKLRQNTKVPLAVYQVSGEYSMIKCASTYHNLLNNMNNNQVGSVNNNNNEKYSKFIDEKQVVLEYMKCFKRAGADIIVTYFAKDVAKWIHDDKTSNTFTQNSF